jgi:hypothetical protein
MSFESPALRNAVIYTTKLRRSKNNEETTSELLLWRERSLRSFRQELSNTGPNGQIMNLDVVIAISMILTVASFTENDLNTMAAHSRAVDMLFAIAISPKCHQTSEWEAIRAEKNHVSAEMLAYHSAQPFKTAKGKQSDMEETH